MKDPSETDTEVGDRA
ncbi:hypothetical protein ACC772_37825, partial [Rhizobium ruizarguesonis]